MGLALDLSGSSNDYHGMWRLFLVLGLGCAAEPIVVSVSELCAERGAFEGHRVSLGLTRDDVSITWFITTLIACDNCCNATMYRFEVACGDDPIALWPAGVAFDAFELEVADTELTCLSLGLGPSCPAEHCFDWLEDGVVEGRVVESDGGWYLLSRR